MKLADLQPRSLHKAFSKHGIEESDLEKKDSDLHINLDNFEDAADLRRTILDQGEFNCFLINNPKKGTPTVVIDQILQ